MPTPIRPFVVYENPETSEVSGEFNDLASALTFRARRKAQIIQNGVVKAEAKRGRWVVC